VFFAALNKMKFIYTLLLILTFSLTTESKPKYGVIKIHLSPAMRVQAVNPDLVLRESVGPITDGEFQLPPGINWIEVTLPDGETWQREFNVVAGKICSIDLTYTPPVERVVEKVEKCPEVLPEKIEAKPEAKPPLPKPWKWDECCSCKRDDLKARLDALAIELKRDPKVRLRIIALNLEAWDYLLSRGVEQERILVQSPKSGPYPVLNPGVGCVEMWILPEGVEDEIFFGP
jgi:hypothetical protein